MSPIDLDQLGRNVSEPLKVEVASALAVQVKAARAAAEAIVLANVEPIRRFAAVLAEAGELTGDDLRRAIDDAGFIAPADLR